MKSLLFIAAGLISTSCYAAFTSSAELVISGKVDSINELEITPVNATTLLIEAGETNRLVATVAERSNSFSGYKISMRSVNASKLVNAADVSGNTYTTYTVLYDTDPTVLTLTTVDQPVKNVSNRSALTTVSSDVKVNVVAKPGAPAGTYSDTITISIAAN